MEYPKTENLFARDEVTHKLIPGEFRRTDLGQIDRWGIVTEKIDGTNIRLMLDARHGFGEARAEVRGRSDAANLPKNFSGEALGLMLGEEDELRDRLSSALAAIQPDHVSEPVSMVVYGEGYGPGIQKGGGDYAHQKSLRIFDVCTFVDNRPPLWRTWADVETVASVLGLKTAPVLLAGAPTAAIVDFVQEDLYSQVAYQDLGIGEEPQETGWPDALRRMEGIVARTDPYLYDYRGHRVMFKLKAKDLAPADMSIPHEGDSAVADVQQGDPYRTHGADYAG